MAKRNCIETSFWDDVYIVELQTDEKLLFIYLLTNTLCHHSGIYEISLKRISFDTGLHLDRVIQILQKLEQDNKIKYQDGYIAIRNYILHHSLNPNMEKGIIKELIDIPQALIYFLANNN